MNQRTMTSQSFVLFLGLRGPGKLRPVMFGAFWGGGSKGIRALGKGHWVDDRWDRSTPQPDRASGLLIPHPGTSFKGLPVPSLGFSWEVASSGREEAANGRNQEFVGVTNLERPPRTTMASSGAQRRSVPRTAALSFSLVMLAEPGGPVPVRRRSRHLRGLRHPGRFGEAWNSRVPRWKTLYTPCRLWFSCSVELHFTLRSQSVPTFFLKKRDFLHWSEGRQVGHVYV